MTLLVNFLPTSQQPPCHTLACKAAPSVWWSLGASFPEVSGVIAMTIPGACGSLSKHHLYTFLFVWRFDSWKRWKLSYSLKQTWFMSICMGAWKIWFISDFRGWGWLKKGQNTDHWPWWFCGSRIEASMELLYYKYLMLLNVKKPTNIFLPESWTMVWVWQYFFIPCTQKIWPSKMLVFHLPPNYLDHAFDNTMLLRLLVRHMHLVSPNRSIFRDASQLSKQIWPKTNIPSS